MSAIGKLSFHRKIIRTFPTFKYHIRGHRVSIPQNFTDYESIKQYNPQIPENFNFAKDVLDVWAEQEKRGQRADGPALWWVNDRKEEVRWSFDELGFHSRRLANVLSGVCSLNQQDRVFLVLPKVPEWWLVNVACLRTGTVLLPGTYQLTARDILHRLQTSRARCVITDESLAPVLDSVASQCSSLQHKLLVSPTKRDGWMNFGDLLRNASSDHECVNTRSDDPMTIFFTSGTTGSPKMTQHSHSSYGIGLTVNGRYWLDLTERDVLWNTSDTGWAKSAWSSVFAPWTQGACVFIHHMPRFNSHTVLETLSNYPITTFCTAPTAYRMLVQEDLSKYHFNTLQHCLSAGEPINPDVMRKWKDATGLDIYEGYGQTETVLIAGTFKGMKINAGSFGKASPAYDVQVVDEAGNVLPRGVEGNIGIRVKPHKPFCLFTEYTDDLVRTAECYVGDFYLTGDRGRMDQDGYLWFEGRADDVILSAGYRIGPFEVENALIEHQAVAESAVVSSPDPIRGEVVKAFVVLTPEYKSQDQDQLVKKLQTHVKEVTAPYKYPRKIEFVEQLPKTISGKIRRVELRNKEWGRS
ncbi:acyl-coenzyme A synthetase ACSM3, mitochondrial isoform X1 [Esox lucius]|uniref:acyl-coenzyme A synthetase ACSM3, mitochondrial isoform X1 n=1 Tax=Esox lucius TaxID=8010 RepID=UPI001477341E|nr:acyl-coenzyme A synthetase ACSM3, mitochondrial isoform X1 [Esox lucius]XP_010892905.2 acyl-coenzyme A synthetase ACSM3, mitochondrial isoform X1 [Esox lucius]XP_019897282.2 acyl-coenzyme A synthetase ACSM3, mitochondrial isoform X1 [Esox lucius]